MQTEDIKKTIEDVLNKLTIDYTDIVIKEEDHGLMFIILSDDAPLLIGEGGVNLNALNSIVKRIIESKSKIDRGNFAIDINYYQTKKNEEIKQKARILGERAKSFNCNMKMEPMTPYERMIVHSAISNDPDIETESVGYGRERHIVIKPKSNN